MYDKKISVFVTVVKILTNPKLTKVAFTCIWSVLLNFFIRQYKANIFRNTPVSQVDHELDEEIPFEPSWVRVYRLFAVFWIKNLGYLLETYGDDAIPEIKEFLVSMADLYRFVAQVYQENLSTTKRPFYLKDGFWVMHVFDPHLFCIPSLHVAVAIRTWTKILDSIDKLDDDNYDYWKKTRELEREAMEIVESILYVKQHSINCVSATMYAMTKFDENLFSPQRACDFLEKMFGYKNSPYRSPSIKTAILDQFWYFYEAGLESDDWKKPLLDFLRRRQI